MTRRLILLLFTVLALAVGVAAAAVTTTMRPTSHVDDTATTRGGEATHIVLTADPREICRSTRPS